MEIIKAYDNKKGRHYRSVNKSGHEDGPSEAECVLSDGTVVTAEQLAEERRAEDEYQEEQERLRQKVEKEEKEEQNPKNLKQVKAFKFKISPVLKRKIWGSIAIVQPHLIASYAKDPNVKILRTTKELTKANEELKEIDEWKLKKELEFDKKYGTDRNDPKWIQAWLKIDPS